MNTIVGQCPRCGSPIYAPAVWNGITPPPSTPSCNCFPPNTVRYSNTTGKDTKSSKALDKISERTLRKIEREKREDMTEKSEEDIYITNGADKPRIIHQFKKRLPLPKGINMNPEGKSEELKPKGNHHLFCIFRYRESKKSPVTEWICYCNLLRHYDGWLSILRQPPESEISYHEYQRLVNWMKDEKREPAMTAFTAGNCRQMGRAFEEYMETKPPESGVVKALKEIANYTWNDNIDYKIRFNYLQDKILQALKNSSVTNKDGVSEVVEALKDLMPFLEEDESSHCLSPEYDKAIKRAKQALEKYHIALKNVGRGEE